MLLGRSNAQANIVAAKPVPSNFQALDFADAHSALIASLSLSQLQTTRDRLLSQFPQSRGSLALVTLASDMLLGFSPFEKSAWNARGFDTGARVLFQIGTTTETETSPWRARIVLRAHTPRLAKAALVQLRFAKRALLKAPKDSPLQSLLGLKSKAASALHAQLLSAGVLFIAKPRALSGLLVVSHKQNLFVVDYLPNPPAKGLPAKLLRWLIEPVDAPASSAGIDALRTQSLGLWVQPRQVAQALANQEAYEGITPQSSTCQSLVQLAGAGEFASMSLRAQLEDQKLSLDLRWHLNPKSTLSGRLALQAAPLHARTDAPLYIAVHLASLGGFRQATLGHQAQAWDLLWRNLAHCTPAAKSLATVFAWPEILGLFVSELSALHPQARVLIENLGPISASVIGSPTGQEVQVEAWMAEAGTDIARRWLKAIFGRERQIKGLTRWGAGPMRPYALRRGRGDVLGAYLGPDYAPFAVKGEERQSSQPIALAEIRIRPKAVQKRLLNEVGMSWLRAWTYISGRLSFASNTLRFTITLKTD